MDKDIVKGPLVPRPPPCNAKNLDDLNEATLTEIMKHYFKVSELQLRLLDNEGAFTGFNDQFQSDIKKWKVQISIGNICRTLTIVIKVPVSHFFGRLGTRSARQMFTETFWYKYAHPVLSDQFPEIANISPSLYFAYSNHEDSFRPTCTDKLCCLHINWLCRKEDKGIILMENVCEENRPTRLPAMITLDKTKVMSLGHVKVALKTLAMFHGCWWLWLHKQKGNQDCTEGPMNYQDVHTAFYTMRKSTPGMFKNFLKPTYQAYKLLLQAEDKAIMLSKVRHYWKHQCGNDIARMITDTSLDHSSIKTICHGDYWNNNMLFSSRDGDHPDLSVTVIDYQGLAFRHPAMDIWYFIYTSTDRAFRDTHLQDCLKTYFDIFSQYILKEDKVKITFDEFCAELDSRRILQALIWAPWVSYITLNPEKTEMDSFSGWAEMNRKMVEKIGTEPNKDDHPMIVEIRRRRMETLEELINLGIL